MTMREHMESCPWFAALSAKYGFRWFKSTYYFSLSVNGKEWILSSSDFYPNVYLSLDGWTLAFRCEQVPPYTTVTGKCEDGNLVSMEIQSSYYTKGFEYCNYNEAFLYSNRYLQYIEKHYNEVAIDNVVADMAEICHLVNGSVIEPKYKAESDFDGSVVIDTADTIEAELDWNEYRVIWNPIFF